MDIVAIVIQVQSIAQYVRRIKNGRNNICSSKSGRLLR